MTLLQCAWELETISPSHPMFSLPVPVLSGLIQSFFAVFLSLAFQASD